MLLLLLPWGPSDDDEDDELSGFGPGPPDDEEEDELLLLSGFGPGPPDDDELLDELLLLVELEGKGPVLLLLLLLDELLELESEMVVWLRELLVWEVEGSMIV